MKNLLICSLLIVLFSCPAIADSLYPNYVEGEVLVVTNMPATFAYSAMGTSGASAYSQAISDQAEAFARSFGLKALNTYPEIAVISGKSIIHLRSEKST